VKVMSAGIAQRDQRSAEVIYGVLMVARWNGFGGCGFLDRKHHDKQPGSGRAAPLSGEGPWFDSTSQHPSLLEARVIE